MAAGIGEAASILGILGVAGQAIESASTLYTFCKAYKEVTSELERMLTDIESLISLLVEIKRLLPALSAASASPGILDAVQRQVQTCNADLATWTEKIDSLGLDTAMGPKPMLKKVKIAADKGYFAGIRAKLSSKREEITLLIALLASHTSSKTLLNSSLTIDTLDALKEDQTSIRDESYRRFDTLHQGINVLLKNTSTLDEKLHSLSLFDHLSARSNETQWRQSVDARLRRAEKQIPQSRRLPKVGTLAHRGKRFQKLPILKSTEVTGDPIGLPPAENNRKTTECSRANPFRLVKPAILIQEENGIMSKELIALEDKRFNSASSNRKLALIQYIQKLRLILWLLERRNYLTFRYNYLGRPARSHLGYQGALNSSWDLANTYTDLLRSLRARNIDLSTTVPWIRKKAWLQYMFDRVRDQDNNAETTMQIIVNTWEHFPIPDEGEVPQYYLTLPKSSINEGSVCALDWRNGETMKPLNEDVNFGEYDYLQGYSALLVPWQDQGYATDLDSSLDGRGAVWPFDPPSDDTFSSALVLDQSPEMFTNLGHPNVVKRKHGELASTASWTLQESLLQKRVIIAWERTSAACVSSKLPEEKQRSTWTDDYSTQFYYHYPGGSNLERNVTDQYQYQVKGSRKTSTNQTQYKCSSCRVAISQMTADFGGVCGRCKRYKRHLDRKIGLS